MTTQVEALNEAIAAAVAPVLLEYREHLLGDWAFVASTLATDSEDENGYVTVFSDAPRHNQIGIVAILSSEVDLGFDEVDV